MTDVVVRSQAGLTQRIDVRGHHLTADEPIADAFGEASIPAMRECVDSLDYEMIRHGHRVLAALGDEASQQWLRDDDVERIEAYLERKGFSDVEGDDPVANETDEAKRTA